MAAASTTPQISTKSPTIRRILREAAELSNSPSPDYTAEPLESDLFEWHFTLRGPPNSVYSEGIYHGRIVLPPAYPLRPPSFRFTTPNGRFEANREICLSISGHHEETWQPAWGIRTALVALRSFMETDARGQLGGLETTEAVRRRLAKESASFRCSTCAKPNIDIITECEGRCRQHSSPEQDVQVPKELSMGWRDEMEASKKPHDPLSHTPTKPTTTTRENDSSSDAELAEGFVQTVTDLEGEAPTSQTFSSSPRSVNPGHSTYHQTPTSSRAVQNSAHQPLRASTEAIRLTRRDADDSVPLWIDRAIVALVVLLIALLLKVLFGI